MSGGSAESGCWGARPDAFRADDRKRIRGMREFEVTFPTLLMQLHQPDLLDDVGAGRLTPEEAQTISSIVAKRASYSRRSSWRPRSRP